MRLVMGDFNIMSQGKAYVLQCNLRKPTIEKTDFFSKPDRPLGDDFLSVYNYKGGMTRTTVEPALSVLNLETELF